MINADTKLYGLFGHPIKHTFSPAMHNAAFEKLGLNSVYAAFNVTPIKIGDAIKSIASINMGGVNLTIPHKERALVYLDRVDNQARLIGAVNTIIRKDGLLIGYNTDGIGLITALKKDLRLNPKGRNIFILGAGGAAKAAAIQLAGQGAARIILADLVYRRAQNLSLRIRHSFSDCKVKVISPAAKELSKNIKECDLLINATPVGMKKSDPLLIDPDCLHRRLAVYDLIYNPPETKLLKCAKQKRLRTANGLGMLLYQGAASFRLWTGRKAPIDVMGKALLKQSKLLNC
ncbi:MAG: shikimate dehydrogenase [Candidatus Omnitrophota bacterium]|nr:shikimate dehydrogenase [Candidatus Omnitrophota bacterium]